MDNVMTETTTSTTSDTKVRRKRRGSKEFREQEAQAKVWVREEAKNLVANSEEGLTAAAVMTALDERDISDIPLGYALLKHPHFYQKRYHLVRNELERMRKNEQLATGYTVNARGRDHVLCYRKSEIPPTLVVPEAVRFDLMIEGPASKRVLPAIQKWLEGSQHSLVGITRLEIKRVGGVANEAEKKGKRSKRRGKKSARPN